MTSSKVANYLILVGLTNIIYLGKSPFSQDLNHRRSNYVYSTQYREHNG